ncbi:MAG: ABC transporter permease [Thermoleophilia bacterium]
MLLHLVKDSLVRRRRRVALAVLSLLVGTALISALLTVSLDIEDKMGKEMRSFGANILLSPRSETVPVEIAGMPVGEIGDTSYLNDSELAELKTIFWKNNITGFAPYLYGSAIVQGEQAVLVGTWFEQEISTDKGAFATGIRKISPWWQVEGEWPGGRGQLLIGRELADHLGISPGDPVKLESGGSSRDFRVAGVVSTGSFEENQIFVDLAEAQELLGLPGKVEKVQVSALTKPPDELARRAQLMEDPKEGLSPADYEKWYCSPYIDAITYQIEEAFPDGQAKPVRQVAEAEGAFLGKLKLLFALIAVVAAVTSAMGVTATMSATVMERRGEIGLMKALGAENSHIAGQFLLEAAFIGLIGGVAGYGAGIGLAALIGRQVFDSSTAFSLPVLPLAIALLAIALLGSALPVRRASHIQPIQALKG